MVSFSHRSSELEMMDLPGFSIEEYRRCLKDISRMSRLTKQDRQLISQVRAIYQSGSWSKSRPMTVLEVGFGSGELLIQLALSGMHLRLMGVELNSWAQSVAQENLQLAGVRDVALFLGDASQFASGESVGEDVGGIGDIDIIVSSLVAHHLSDQELQEHIRWMSRKAQKAWLMNDLERHPAAYWGAHVLAKALGVCEMVENDAPLSVLRARTKKEWACLLKACSIERLRWKVKGVFPFKILITGNIDNGSLAEEAHR